MKLFSWIAGLFGRETYDPFWRETDEQYLRKMDAVKIAKTLWPEDAKAHRDMRRRYVECAS